MNTYETIDYKGMKINIFYDEDAESPREWDNFGTIYSCHRYYNPDEHRPQELEDAYEEWDKCNGDNFAEFLDEFYFWLPIGYYEHTGITVWVGKPSADWDSGTFGIIAVPKDKAKKECIGDTEEQLKERALKYLEGEIEILDTYFTGEVYGFVAEDTDGEEIDSCWGFYGDSGIEDAIIQAKSSIDYMLELRGREELEAFNAQLRKHIAKRKSQIRHHVPFYARTAFVFDY